MIADLPEGIAVSPVFAADKAEALLEAGKLPSEAAFNAACQAPERQVVDAPGLLELISRTPKVKRLLNTIETAGAALAAELQDDSWTGQISWNDARMAAEQLRWLSKQDCCPRFQERCHPSDQYIRGLEDMTNSSLQLSR